MKTRQATPKQWPYSQGLICALLVAAPLSSQGEISTPAFFSDGMVLQRDLKASIWGQAEVNTEVSVQFANQTLTTTSSTEGTWKVTFQNLVASSTGAPLTITAGKNTKTINDVLVGEVWHASGQSNMEWTMAKSSRADLAQTATDPLLRVYVAKNTTASTPQGDFQGTWQSTKPGNTENFTATGWEFAKRLREELGVPVGILETAWGAKSVEAYTSHEALLALPEAKIVLDRKSNAIKDWHPDKAREKYKAALATHKEKLEAYKENKNSKKRAPKPPKKPEDPSQSPDMHSNLYNGMIAPLVGYGIRGSIWYQGENNANTGTSEIYEELLTCMIQDWRTRWGYDFSFYFVQLANFRKATQKPGVENTWVNVQDEMRKTLNNVKKTGMAIINDIGTADNIHPPNKHDVGGRLARWALAKDYGKTGFSLSGPIYKSHSMDNGQFLITFDHAKGLQSRDGKDIARLEITDGKGQWHWAQSEIKGTTLRVWHESIRQPTRVRYAWASNPTGANLVNGEGLPASCFDTAAE